MFNFLKTKLKSWFGESKKEIEGKVGKSKVKEKAPKKEKKLGKEKKVEKRDLVIKEEKVRKKEKSKADIEHERGITEEVMKDISQEKHEIKTPEEQVEEGIAKEEIKEEEAKKFGFFEKLKKVFAYNLTEDRFNEIFSGLELLLLESNVALEVVEKLHGDLKQQLVGKQLKKDRIESEIKEALRTAIENMLIEPEDTIEEIKEFRKLSKENKEPYKILFFGINGAGKTTSIAKFADLCIKNKLSCIVAAADTFRAASIEQLQIHADKLGIKMIKHEYGSDPAAVAFDAIKYAKQNDIDVVLIDTAGRMHTKENLLHEMEKISRISKPNLKIFVAEAIAGNDATEQAKAFNEMIGIDGSILSKVDVDEKGGTIISIGYITKKPILYLGIGQNYGDLELFDKKKFIKQLGLG